MSPVSIVFESFLEVLIPIILSMMIDKGITPGNMGEIKHYGLILVICSFISLFFGILSGEFAARASSGFAKNLRKKLYYTVQDFSFANIDKFSTASLITRMTTDVTNVQNAFQMIIRIAVRAPVMLIFALIMAHHVNARLMLIYLIVIPILGFGLWYIASHAYVIFERVFKTYDKLNRIIQENLRGIRVVKSFVREDHEIKKFEDASDRIYVDFSAAERLLALNSPMMQFSIYICMLLISWFAAKMIVAGNMTTGQLVSMISYTMQILISMMMISIVFVMITISRSSADRIIEVMDEKPEIVNGPDPVYAVKDGSVSFDHVKFTYRKQTGKEDESNLCLKDISLDIKSGEVIGIIGGTGSAKSTLVSMIPRIYDVDSGSVKVGGIDVRKYDLETLRNAVAVVLQKNTLFSGTIKDNLRWGKEDATDEEMTEACKLAQADEFIQAMPDKYDTWIDQGGSNVSGGQKQRLCIARALLKSPKILILDDSTSAVDTQTDLQIRMAFREKIPNVTKFIISQRIASVQDADRIIVMDNGMVNGFGTHAELIRTNQIYREVYQSQTKEELPDE